MRREHPTKPNTFKYPSQPPTQFFPPSSPMFRRTSPNFLRISSYSSTSLCETPQPLNSFKAVHRLVQQRRLRSLASPPPQAVAAINNAKGPGSPNPRNIRSMATSDPSVPASLDAAPPRNEHPKLSKVEESKRRAAYKAVEDHFDPSYRYIGIGSGSTVVYVVEAIAAKGRNVTSKMVFIPTGMCLPGKRIYIR